MRNSIAMQDLTYSSEPEIVLARNRNTKKLIEFNVKKIERYESTKGVKMVKYTTESNTYKKNNTFYVNYGLNGDRKNISLHPHIAPAK